MNILKNNNQSISKLASQLIRHYQIPVHSGKKEALDAIMKKIDLQDQSEKKKRYVSSTSQFVRTGISIAAVFAIVITFYLYTSHVTVSAGDKETYTCRLPDASRVVLHNESEIKYNKYFWGRGVKLSGEAYFEVEKGPGFNVKTKVGDVEVLGTRFLVSSKEQELKVLCFQGRVTAHYSDNTYILDTGMEFSGQSGETKKEALDGETAYPPFAIFNRTFSNEKLNEVTGQLESFFDIKIDLQDVSDKNFSGTIETGNPESAIKIVCESLQLKYRSTEMHHIIVFN